MEEDRSRPDYCGIEIEVHPLKTLESNIQERGDKGMIEGIGIGKTE